MEQLSPMKIIILEDDKHQCNLFVSSIERRSDIELVAITNSCIEAIKYIKSNNVEGVVVDLELNNGIGESGLEFLSELNKLQLDAKPIIIVNTNISQNLVHDAARNSGADWIFCKGKPDYSLEKVLNTFIRLRESHSKRIPKSEIDIINKETKDQRKIRIKKKINIELDKLGVGHHLKGRKYLFDAIYYLLEINNDGTKSYMPYLTEKHKRVNGTISNSMQTAITRTWSQNAIQDLQTHYTANVSYKSGTPTPTEFICYYVDKIKELI